MVFELDLEFGVVWWVVIFGGEKEVLGGGSVGLD